MGNPYLEAFKAYEHRIRSSRLIFAMAVFLAGMMLLLVLNTGHGRSLDNVPGVLAIGTVAITDLWIHFRETIVSPRRHLVPGYTKPHVVAFVVIMSLCVIVWPAMLMSRAQSTSFATIAVMATICALLGWFILTISWTVFFLGFLGYTFAFSDAMASQNSTVLGFFRGQHEFVACGLLTASLLATVVAIIRMVRLTEETDLYHRRIATNAWEMRARMTGDGGRTWSQKLKDQGAFVALSKGKLYLARSDRMFDRARQWRSLKPNTFWFMTVMAIFMTGSGMMTQVGTGTPKLASTMFTALWLFQMPTLTVAQGWLQAWRFLEIDSLKPISQARWLKEIGFAMAIDTAQAWAVFAGAFLVASLVVGASDRQTIVITLLASLGAQVFLFAGAIWILRFRSPIVLVAGMFGLSLTPIVGFSLSLTEYFAAYRVYALPVAALLVLVGLVVVKDAYRRWLTTELG